jgi:hypothetical protein
MVHKIVSKSDDITDPTSLESSLSLFPVISCAFFWLEIQKMGHLHISSYFHHKQMDLENNIKILEMLSLMRAIYYFTYLLIRFDLIKERMNCNSHLK